MKGHYEKMVASCSPQSQRLDGGKWFQLEEQGFRFLGHRMTTEGYRTYLESHLPQKPFKTVGGIHCYNS